MRMPGLDKQVWGGLCMLCVGLVLLNASFMVWRDDARSWPFWDGSQRATADAMGLHHGALETRLEDRRILITMAAGGLGLLIAATVALNGISKGGTHLLTPPAAENNA